MQNVMYIEGSDFKNGVLDSDGRPSIVMCYADYCGHCTQAKPQFQTIPQIAPQIRACAIHGADGDASDKEAEKVMRSLNPQFRGYPCYLLFDKNGKFVTEYSGNRDARSIIEFCNANAK